MFWVEIHVCIRVHKGIIRYAYIIVDTYYQIRLLLLLLWRKTMCELESLNDRFFSWQAGEFHQ